MNSADEAIILLAKLQDIDKRYPIIKDLEEVEQVKILAIENCLLKFANHNVAQSLYDESDDDN